MKRFMIGTILVLGSVYLIALAALYILQRSVLYIPPKVYLTPVGVDLSSAVEVPAPNEPNNIMGWWFPPKEEGAPTFLYFHGNGSAVYSANDVYRTLHEKGYGVFALAYPGYPGREGQTTQQSLTEAAIEGYDFWIHGTHDNVIPLSVGQALHDSYDGPKSAHVIPNGQHNNLWHLGGEDIILSALAKVDGA